MRTAKANVRFPRLSCHSRLALAPPKAAMAALSQFQAESGLSGHDNIADISHGTYHTSMTKIDHQSGPTLDVRLSRSALPFGAVSLAVALVGSLAPLPLGIPMAIAGLILFATAAMISGYVMLTKEMKSARELGFDRTRDALIYSSSFAGMDWRLVGLAFSAFAASFLIGFGLLGKPNSGGALLSFGTFAYLGAITRLQRRWPKDEQGTADWKGS
jgi:hypothetical protein